MQTCSGQQPDKVFAGKTDPWFIGIMACVVVLMAALGVAWFQVVSWVPWRYLAPLPALAGLAMAILPVRSNRVELFDDRLVVVYALAHASIYYSHIRSVRRTRSLWAGTANSLDRVYIEAPIDGDAIVAVKDNDELVAELVRRCGLDDAS